MTTTISSELKLPCGAVLPNRLCKAAMTEGLADEMNRATARHAVLYGRWAQGGAGLLITGNVQVDRRFLERAGNVSIDNDDGLDELRAYAAAGSSAGNHIWMQISHPGRQAGMGTTKQSVAPSAIALNLGGGFAKPRALTSKEIENVIERFAYAAKTAKDTGFTGVQIHSAHGYLLSQFLSPLANQRDDKWGGCLENRARLLLSVVRAVRAVVGPAFPIGLKLNTADFQQGGFDEKDSMQVVEWLNNEGIDLLELSGGTYEQPAMGGVEGDEKNPIFRTSSKTKDREVYFLETASKFQKVAKMPIMITGGFRSRDIMNHVIANGECDVIGLARPLCVDADVPNKLMNGTLEKAVSWETKIPFGTGFWGTGSPIKLLKMINTWGTQGWFCLQIIRMSENLEPNVKLGVLRALINYQSYEKSCANKRLNATPGIDSGN